MGSSTSLNVSWVKPASTIANKKPRAALLSMLISWTSITWNELNPLPFFLNGSADSMADTIKYDTELTSVVILPESSKENAYEV